MPAFPTPIQYTFGIPSHSNKTRARSEKDSNRKGRSQTTPIWGQHDHIPKYPKNSTKKNY
jgi:hypothetical protein